MRALLTDINTHSPRLLSTTLGIDQQTSEERPSWCRCGYCVVLEKDRMNICCGQVPCLSQHPTFTNITKPDVLEIAGLLNYADHFHTDPEYDSSKWRNCAYRFFILWQWSKLGAGNRKAPPACCCHKIRQLYPAADNVYTGYISGEEGDALDIASASTSSPDTI